MKCIQRIVHFTDVNIFRERLTFIVYLGRDIVAVTVPYWRWSWRRFRLIEILADDEYRTGKN